MNIPALSLQNRERHKEGPAVWNNLRCERRGQPAILPGGCPARSCLPFLGVGSADNFHAPALL